MHRRLVPTQRHSFCHRQCATWHTANALQKVIDWSCCPVPRQAWFQKTAACACHGVHAHTVSRVINRHVTLNCSYWSNAFMLARWHCTDDYHDSPCWQAKQPAASTTSTLQLFLYSSWDIYSPLKYFLLHGTLLWICFCCQPRCSRLPSMFILRVWTSDTCSQWSWSV